ncbi:MAG: helix-turn-helix domain-containing protein [Methylocystis sp.]|nr:helix-turn-helix domain-containing protein [Methylocystis sp.]
MKANDFDGLMRGLAEARAFARDEKVEGLKVHVPTNIDVAAIRRKVGLSQIEFARRIGVSSATLRNWEQGRRAPEGPARVLLALLARNPRIVEETLGDAA